MARRVVSLRELPAKPSGLRPAPWPGTLKGEGEELTPVEGSRKNPLDKGDVKGKHEGLTAEAVRRGVAPLTRLKPHLGRMMAEGYSVIDMELRRLREKAESGKPLTPSETRQLEVYLKGLSQLAREEREQERRNPIEDLADEELVAQAEQALKALKGEE